MRFENGDGDTEKKYSNNSLNLSVRSCFMPAKLNNKDFARLSEFITGEFGIKMPDIKRIMLQSRLQKRLNELGFNNFSDYVDYLFSKKGMEEEVIHMIDVVSTNKTEFFRENVHFEYLLRYPFTGTLSTRKKRKPEILECRLFKRRRTLHAGDGSVGIPD